MRQPSFLKGVQTRSPVTRVQHSSRRRRPPPARKLYVEQLEDRSLLSGTWTETGSMLEPSARPPLARLLDGRVLAAVYTAQLYDPGTGTWTLTSLMRHHRNVASAALLSDGRVLVAGGVSAANAEVYDPAMATWKDVGGWQLSSGYARSATLLTAGRVLIAGGLSSSAYPGAALYDPKSNTWTATGLMNEARYRHEAARLADGRVLVVGGLDDIGGAMDTAEIYDPTTGTWTLTGRMNGARAYHAMARMGRGVLVTGGWPHRTAEVYDPDRGTWELTGSTGEAHLAGTLTPLGCGRFLVAGCRTSRAFARSRPPVEWRAGTVVSTPPPAQTTGGRADASDKRARRWRDEGSADAVTKPCHAG